MSESQLPCTDRVKPGYIKRDGKYYKHVAKREACKSPTVDEMRAALKKAGCKGYSKMKRAQIIKEYLKRQECAVKAKSPSPKAAAARAKPKPLPKRPAAVQRLISESLKDATKMASLPSPKPYRSPKPIVAPPNSAASPSDYEMQLTPVPKKLHISLSPDDDTPSPSPQQTMKKKLHLSLSPDDTPSPPPPPPRSASKKASASASKKASASSKKASASSKSPSPARPAFAARGLTAPRKQQQGFWSWVGWGN